MPIYKTGESKNGLMRYRVRVNYTDSNGKPHALTHIAYGLSEAKELEHDLLQARKSLPVSRLTIPQLMDEYLAVKKMSVRESTYRKDREILFRYIRPLDVKLDKLTSQRLNAWKLELNKLPLSFTMKQNIYGSFRTMLNWAVKMDYLDKNPLLKIGNFRNAYQEKKELQYYTPEEFRRYIVEVEKIASEKGLYDYYVFFMLLYFTGARKGEIHALRWSDVKGGTISITKSISQKLGDGDRETPPKNMSSNRVIQIPEPLQAVLDRHYETAKTYRGFSDSYHVTGGLRPLRDTSIEQVNIEAAKRAVLHHIRIHDFRHSHASLLANSGVNILEISRRLGHSNIEQTLNTYSHFYPAEEEKALGILNKIRV